MFVFFFHGKNGSEKLLTIFFSLGESTKLVSEYKAKLQQSEADNAKLEGTVRSYIHILYVMLTDWYFRLVDWKEMLKD